MKKLKLFILASLIIGAIGVGVGCSGPSDLAQPTEVEYNLDNDLTWAPVDDAKSYQVEILNVATGEVQNLTAKRTSPKVNLGFLAQGDYEIRVRALGREGETEGEWSKVVYFKKGYETGCVYTLINDDTEYAITKYGDASGTIYIEDEYRDKPVTEISSRAFKGCADIEYVHVGNNVERIGDNAFYNCKNLKGVYFEEESKLEYIGVGSFHSCGLLESFVVPKGVTVIYDSAFEYCRSLKEITLHDNLTAIDAYAFSECSALTSVEIPDSVTFLGSAAYSGCSGVQAVTLGEGLTQVTASAFYKCTALTTINFPTEGNLTAIGASAFSECIALTSVVIPEGVSDIGASAFSMTVEQVTGSDDEITLKVNSQLADIDLPSTITHIGASAFFGTKVYMDAYMAGELLLYVDDWLVDATAQARATVKRLSTAEKEAEFADKELDEAVLFRDGIVGIGDSALSNFLLLDEVYLPNSVKYIGNSAFRKNILMDTIMAEPHSVVSIGKYAFMECSILKNVVFGDGLKSIGEYAFAACSRLDNTEDNVIIPDTVETVENMAFYGTALIQKMDEYGVVYANNWIVSCSKNTSKATISEDCVGIATYAFANTKLSTLTIPNKNKLSYIMRGAFYKCENLDMVNLTRTNVKEIGDYAFYECASLSNIDLPINLEKIGQSAFSKCEQLDTIDLSGNKLESIGDRAFFGCVNLAEVEFGKALKSIGRAAFYKCNALEEIAIPATVSSLGDYAFAQCKALEKVTIGNQVATIGNYAFANCESLKRVSLSAGVKNIGDYAFYGCTNLLIFSMSEGLETIGAHAFSGANRLMELILPSTLKSIGKQAFRGCASLETITIPASVETIDEHAFYACFMMTIYVEDGAAADAWNKMWNSSCRPVVWGCTLAEDGQYVVSVTIGEDTLSNTWCEDGFIAPYKKGYTFMGWAIENGGQVAYDAQGIADIDAGVTLYAIWQA